MTITKDEAVRRVTRGAAHLDRLEPTWFTVIDIGTLTLSSSCLCVLGQIRTHFRYKDWGELLVDHPNAKGAIKFLSGEDMGCYYEEDAETRTESYAVLQDAWIAAIADRRLTVEAVQAHEAPSPDAAVARVADDQRVPTPRAVEVR